MKKERLVVEVFRTDITDKAIAVQVIKCLSSAYEGACINFDLEDVDRILRIASTGPVQTDVVIAVVESFGYHADVLPDVVEEKVEV